MKNIILALLVAIAAPAFANPVAQAERRWVADNFTGVYGARDGSGLLRIELRDGFISVTIGDEFMQGLRYFAHDPSIRSMALQIPGSGELITVRREGGELLMFMPDGQVVTWVRLRPLAKADRDFMSCRTLPAIERQELQLSEGLRC